MTAQGSWWYPAAISCVHSRVHSHPRVYSVCRGCRVGTKRYKFIVYTVHVIASDERKRATHTCECGAVRMPATSMGSSVEIYMRLYIVTYVCVSVRPRTRLEATHELDVLESRLSRLLSSFGLLRSSSGSGCWFLGRPGSWLHHPLGSCGVVRVTVTRLGSLGDRLLLRR